MDGVLCDYVGRCEELGINPDEAKHVPGFFRSLKPIEGAIEAYRKLHAKYDVYILTAASRTTRICVRVTFSLTIVPSVVPISLKAGGYDLGLSSSPIGRVCSPLSRCIVRKPMNPNCATGSSLPSWWRRPSRSLMPIWTFSMPDAQL